MKANNGKLWGTIGDIEIRTVTKADLEESLNILDKSFYLNESVCNGCEINLPENKQARQELRELCRITAEDGISLVAKSTKTGQCVGVSFNKIQFPPEKNEKPFFIKFRDESTHSLHAQNLMDFMIDVDSRNDVFELYNLNSVCELMFLATLPDWGRQGIAHALGQYTIELTRQFSKGIGLEDIHPSLRLKRPGAVTALFTSIFSQKVGRKLGFDVINKVYYTEFSFNGKKYSERINPLHKGCEHVVYLIANKTN